MAYAEYHQAQGARQFVQRLRQFETGMLITHGPNGTFHGRPMAVAEVESNESKRDESERDDSERLGCYLWFLTDSETPKMDEIRLNRDVLVAFQNQQGQFLTASGQAEIIQDKERIEGYWRDSFRTWFPLGKTDPSLSLLRVRVDQGKLWEPGLHQETLSF